MNIKPTSVLRVITIFSRIISIWPTDPNSHFIKRLIKETHRYFLILNATIFTILQVSCISHFRHEMINLMKVLSETAAIIIPLINIVCFKWKENQVRILLDEVVTFVMTVEGESKVILHKWVNRYMAMWIFVGVNFVLAAVMFSASPLLTSDSYPTTTWYPFEVELYTTTYYFLFVHQVIAAFQAGLGVTVDIIISFLFCYLSAKLNILSNRLEICSNSEDLNDCIREHKHCIEFFEMLANSVEFMMIKNIYFMVLTIICGAIPLLSKAPFAETSQFISIIITSYMRSYMSMWPPDDVRDMSEKIATSIYACSWIGASRKMQNCLTIAIFRAQKPLIVAIPGVLPPSTLQYFASFLSTTFSYFTALRAVIGK